MNKETAMPIPAASPALRPGLAVTVIIVAAALAAGVAGRLYATSLAPRYAYTWDHFDNIQMGRAAAEDGLFRVYGVPKEKLPTIKGLLYDPNKDDFSPINKPAVREVNYPPLGVTLFWVQDALLRSVSPGPVNTFNSRLIMSIASVLAEILLAVIVYLLVRRLVGHGWALAAAAICWLFPPLAMDSSFWGQTDSWFMAPAALAVLLMIRRRWLAAGVCMAVTVLLKPQGIFMGPIALMAVILLPEGDGKRPGIEKMGRRCGKMFGSAIAAVMLLSLPWTLSGGADWIDKAYLANFRMYGETTLKAFNIWYLDALRLDAMGAMNPVDCSDTIAAIAKDTWGRLLTIASLLLLGGYTLKRFRDKPELGLVIFAGLWLWSTFMLPTRVHERYIVYGMPLLIVAAAAMKRLWPAVLVLAIVGAAELSHNVWLKTPPGTYAANASYMLARYERFVMSPPPGSRPPTRHDLDVALADLREQMESQRDQTRGAEHLLAGLCVLAYAWAVIVPFRRKDTPVAAVPHKAEKRRR